MWCSCVVSASYCYLGTALRLHLDGGAVRSAIRSTVGKRVVAGLDAADWDGALRVGRGKGDKERLVPLAGGAAAALGDWVTLRGDRPGGSSCRSHATGRLSVSR